MKIFIKSHLIIVILLTIVALSACEDGEEELSLNVIATPSIVNRGDTVIFEITGNAETFSIYTGDRGHNYDSSFLAIADGQEVDLGSLILTTAALDSSVTWLQGVVNGYNNTTKNSNNAIRNDTTIAESEKVYQDTIVFEEMMADLREFIVDNDYANLDEAAYDVSSNVMSFLPVSTVREFVEDNFEDQGTRLAPRTGYDTGESIDRYEMEYSYVYDRPGTYTVTVIATDVSWKNYSGSGYVSDRTATADEYAFNRLIKQVIVEVQ